MTSHWLRAWGMHASEMLGIDLPRGHHHHCHQFRAPEWLEDRALLSTLLVSNPGDHGSGTFRDAIDQANLNPGSTIKFSITGTITLASALPDLRENVTITGPGSSALAVQRNSAPDTPQFGVLVVDSGVTATISGLTVAGGNAASGGGIANAGKLIVSNSAVAGNSAVYGGSIFNSGRLTISNSTFSGDSAIHGGGIFNSGRLTVNNSTFSGDSATYIAGAAAAAADIEAANAEAEVNAARDATVEAVVTGRSDAELAALSFATARAATATTISNGGAIANFGTLTVSNTTLSGNSATIGGAIANYGTLTVNATTLTRNSASNGAGIGNAGTLSVNNSILSENSANQNGGGIGNIGMLTVSNTTLLGNTASGLGGGGIDNFGISTVSDSTISENAANSPLNDTSGSGSGSIDIGGGGGGGIVNFATLTARNTVVVGNSAINGGGILNFGTLTASSATISGNSASNAGGILNTGTGTLIVSNSAFSGNSASSGGTIANFGTLTVNNTTLSANGGNPNGLSGGILINTSNTSGTVIPQSISASISVSPSSSPGAAATNPGEPPASPGAPPAGLAAPSTGLGASSAGTDVLLAGPEMLLANTTVSSADTSKTFPAPGALDAAIVALDSAPCASDARLVPLRESTLALVGTLLVLTLETSTNDDTQSSSALGTMETILVGPAPTTTIYQSLPPPAGLARSRGDALESGSNTRNVANSIPKRATPWEHYVIGLDRDFDQFRPTFPKPPRDEVEPRRADKEVPTSLDHLRATDEVLSTGWPEHAASSVSVHSGSDTLRDLSTHTGPYSPGDDSLIQPADPEEKGPLQVSLTQVVVAMTAGSAWMLAARCARGLGARGVGARGLGVGERRRREKGRGEGLWVFPNP